jgi:hypothetical protein
VTPLHPELVAATQRHVANAVSAYLGGRTITVDAVGLRYVGYVDVEVVASRDPADVKTIARHELGDGEYDLGDIAVFELFLDDPTATMHAWLVEHLGAPRAGLRDAYAQGLRAAASELFGADAATWIGRWFMLAPCALAYGEQIVHPPGDLDPARALLVAHVDVGGVAFGEAPRALTHCDLSAVTSSFGGVRIEKSDVRVAIPLARVAQLVRPADESLAARVIGGHPPYAGDASAAIRAAFAELADGAPGSAVLAVNRLRARLREHQLSFIEHWLVIRMYVLLRRLLVVALDLDQESISRLID